MRQGLIAASICAGLAGPAKADDLSPFVEGVLFHVLLHEMAHGLIRTFDLPVLANEEDMADTFATGFVIRNAGDPVEIITARTNSWFYEADQNPDLDLAGEHPADLRRAYRTLCMLYGSSPADYENIVANHPFTEGDLADCGETAEQQMDAWDAILAPHLGDTASQNVTITYEDVYLAQALRNSEIMDDIAMLARRYDWPDQITFALKGCSGTASWSRSTRTISLCDSYIDRFQSQDVAINN